MKSKLRAAFEAVCEGLSPDRVVADPELNRRFLDECTRLGLDASPATLNRGLLNLRKAGDLRGLQSRRTSFPNEDEYRFAVEMVVRFLERRDGLTLDAIIADPARAMELDQLAANIAPGYEPVQYRWAALNLRKARRLPPDLLAHVVPPTSIETFRVNDLTLESISAGQGLYLFYTSSQALYAGETYNLRSRLKKHLDHSDNKGLARWMWEFGHEQVHLEVQVFPPETTTRIRKALEAEFIRSRKPLFNVKVI